MINIVQIHNMLQSKKIIFDEYNIFLVKEPKYRVIMSQTIKDKLINHIVSREILLKVFEPKMLKNNIATRTGKGTSYGKKMLKKYINKIKLENKKIYYLKCDIKKYFYNIDHSVLKQILKNNIKDKDALDILSKIIELSNSKKTNDIIKKKCNEEIQKNIKNETTTRNKELIEIKKSLNNSKGIPIGNMTSQAFAIIYLNEFDHYIKEKLHAKYYMRYMDDFVILSTEKTYLKNILKEIKEKLKTEYKLELNPKTTIGTLKNGLDFLGHVYILKENKLYIKIRNRVKKNFKRKLKKINKLYLEGKVNIQTINSVKASYKGICKEGNGYYLYYNTVKNSK